VRAGHGTLADDAAAENGTPVHDGLFGPGSVTWRVAAEPVMWVAGFRALYLQALHPRVMRGTWQNTAFADPKQAWGRFLRTVDYVQTRTYGSRAEVERIGRRVRKLHASMRGTDPDGTGFRLDEPELLLWVHCAEIGSYLDVARRCGMTLTDAETDTYVDEQRRSAEVVGLEPATVPGSAAELVGYFESMRPGLHATGEARRALLRSLNPALPRQLMPLKLVVPGVTTLAFATLPRWARRLYGMPGSPLTDLTATASLRALREATTGKPGQLLVMPAARASAHALHRARHRNLPAASSQ
jgi:uncharacterized protein (DUF2236 family)